MIATVTLNPSLDEWVMLPRLIVRGLNRCGPISRYAAGKGINVSRVVRELRGRTIAFGLAGGDDGAILRRSLTRLRVPHHLVHVPGATRNNYKIITKHPRGVTEINPAGPPASARALRQVLADVRTLRPRPAVITLCGSLPSQAPATVYRDWVRALQRVGTPVLLDASGSALRHGLSARPWAIKPNLEEAGEVLGRPLRRWQDRIEAVRALRSRSIRVVMLSMGREGALCSADGLEGVWHAVAPPVRVVSAVGAGDSSVAGLLMGWLRCGDWREGFRLAMACGTACALTPGTELCHRKDVLRLLPRVCLRKVG